jgi:molybdopterin synthase catalytic subunit
VVNVVEGKIIDQDLNLNEIIDDMARYSRDGMGALAIFVGYVKGYVDGKEVYSLKYSSYEPYASEILNKIAQEESQTDGVYDIKIFHRIGDLKPGDRTLYIFVAADSRKTAFKTIERVLERVKSEPYIFKLEKREDGQFWVFKDGKRFKRGK